jgi:hypothetical protein
MQFPGVLSAFGITVPSVADLFLILGLGLGIVIVIEMAKAVFRKKEHLGTRIYAEAK